MLYGKLGIDILTTSELLYPNMKVGIRLIRARPSFYMISENPNVSWGNVDCSLYTRRLMLRDDYHKKRMYQLAYAPVEYNYKETLAKTYIIPARQNQFIQENIFNNDIYSFNTSNSHCNEFKLCLYWLICREPILVSSVIWEILEYSEEDSQLYTTIRQIIVACMSHQWKQWTFKMIFHQFQLINSKTITY